MLRPIIFTAVIVAGLSGVAHADVYRWVDDKGEAHYSDRWVPGSELIKSDKPHPQTPTSASSTPTSAATHPVPPSAADRANEEAVKQDVAKVSASQCKQAKERYQQSIDARRIYKPAQPGDTDRVFMSDAETDAYRAQARSDVTVACGRPPPPVNPDAPAPEPKQQ
jgi:hypothetical protein